VRKPPSRIAARLDALVPELHGPIDLAAPSPALEALHDILVECLDRGDVPLFEALLQRLRSEGLGRLWEYAWHYAMHLACEKFYVDGRGSLLVGVPLYRDWNGQLTAADRRHLTQVHKTAGVLPRSGRLTWFAQPQSIHRLLDLGPIPLWDLNTPGMSMPRYWASYDTVAPVVQVLVGRLEFRETHRPRWSKPQELARQQAEVLGIPSSVVGPCLPLELFLLEDPWPQTEVFTLPVEAIVDHALELRARYDPAGRLLVTETDADHWTIALRGTSGELHSLATIALSELHEPPLEFLERLRTTAQRRGLPCFFVARLDPEPGASPVLH
jgi:hypothetical protein